MYNFALLDKLRSEVEIGNVRESVDGIFSLFKYTEDCAFKDKWNDINVEARGIIFNTATKQIVCRPFKKFFNLEEVESTKLANLPTSRCIIYEKLDGSCASTYLKNGELFAATPGAMQSEQAIWATNWLREHLVKIDLLEEFKVLCETKTFIFEAIYPENLNVVTYNGRTECVLLGIRSHNGNENENLEFHAKWFKFSLPRTFDLDISAPKFVDNEEGYVIYYPNEKLRVKIKSPEYVRLHRIKNYFSPKGLAEVLSDGTYGKLFDCLPPHLQKEADDIAAGLRQKFSHINNASLELLAEIRAMPTRKEQALYIQSRTKDTDIISTTFMLLDKVSKNLPQDFIDRQIWRKIYKQL